MEQQPGLIRIDDLEHALAGLESQPTEWYVQNYGPSYRMCLESAISRRLLWALCERTVLLQRLGADFTIPMVVLAAEDAQLGRGVHAERVIGPQGDKTRQGHDA